MSGYRLLLASVAGAALFVSFPALADVKAGADAWSRGDYPAAVKEWQGPAAQGDADAQFNLGQAYKLGRGVERDLTKAEMLFGKAAAQGHVPAADNYGLLLFDRGERAQAMPYIRAAADRGDPRAQYLLGIAHFNGDLAPKDWVRAYALMTLAQSANLPQAAPALAQMDQYIPLPQRQAAVSLATQLSQKADASRNTQLAAADLGVPSAGPAARPTSVKPSVTPPTVRPEAAVPSALQTAGNDSPATAGADFARPAVVAKPAPAPRPVAAAKPVLAEKPAPAPKPAVTSAPAAKPATALRPASGGAWRIQFGAFGVPANADALWQKLKGRPEVAGHARIDVKSGKVTKLQAGGYASHEAAGAACAGLGKAGITCIPTQD